MRRVAFTPSFSFHSSHSFPFLLRRNEKFIKKSGGHSFAFQFSIGLHYDDREVLTFIKETLSIGKTLVKGVGAKRIAFFNVDIHSELPIIIAIFSKFNLNTTKHLDFLAFAHAFMLYTNNKDSEYRENLKPMLCNIISSMNSNRTNYSMPSVHKLDISAN